MRKIDIFKAAQKFIVKLPPKHARQVMAKITSLAENCPSYDSKILVGFNGLYRADSGEYRIIYRFDDAIVEIIIVGKRNDDEVYKRLRHLMN